MEKETIQWIGICASATMSAASLSGQVFKELSDRRTKARQLIIDRAELVKADGMDFGMDHKTGAHGLIKVRNCGIRPVYLEKVVFGYAVTRNGVELTRWDEIDFDSTRPLSEPLQPGEGREFQLKLWNYQGLDGAIASGDCWISIRSHEGEIARIAHDARMASSLKSLRDASIREPGHSPKSGKTYVLNRPAQPPPRP